MRSITKKTILVTGILVVCIAVFLNSFRTRKYTDPDKYLVSGHVLYQKLLPEQLLDFRGAKAQFLIFGAQEACAFRLSEPDYVIYTEALASSLHEDYKTSYEKFHDLKVSELNSAIGQDYEPFSGEHFLKNVTDQPIGGYQVFFFLPAGSTGGRAYGIFADPDTCRILMYSGGHN